MSPMLQLEPLRAVVVDADAIFAKRLASGLIEYGIETIAVGTEQEALAAIAAQTPDVLVLAPFLRDGSGLQAIEALRGDRSCAVAVIALSRADGAPPPMIAAKCDSVLPKPCSVEQVLDRIDQVLETKTTFANVEQRAG